MTERAPARPGAETPAEGAGRAKPRPFSERVLAWWDRHGRHDLPWQHPRTPYRVWVSEIMLQQTQVATVIPYFERFMERFPGIPELAAAPLDEVLSKWSGLGYYARARHLHRAAKRCVAEHGGELPREAAELLALPGIGESTANAIVSQAFDVPAPVLDGNVRRVLARHAAVAGWTGRAAVVRTLWGLAKERLPAARGADYTQAVMDLGATVCTRARPLCAECPVSEDCRALARNEVDRFPWPRPKVGVRTRELCMLILQRKDGSVLLQRRPPAGIWGGLWSLPEAESREELSRDLGLDASTLEPAAAIEHRLTHRLLRIRPVLAHSEPRPEAVKCSDDLRWFDREEWPRLGLPQPVRELLGQHHKGVAQ